MKFQTTLTSKGEEPVQIEAGNWKGVNHIGIRQLFRGREGKLHYGKQGINIPVDDFLTFAAGMIQCFNDATGSTVSLHGADDVEEQYIADLFTSINDDMHEETPEEVTPYERY
jgi:hypothetical protein